MASRDDHLRPKPGRIRSLGKARPRLFLHRVLKEMSFTKPPASRSTFTGYRLGRGNDLGRYGRAGYRFGPAYRRVIIKTRLVRLKARGGARTHLRYIQREGVSRDGKPGGLYGRDTDHADGAAFLERGQGDRHQFRFIVSPEDAAELADLKPFIRDLMGQMERDLGTRLDWVAVDHYNTDNPHTHIVLRGKDDRGRDLIIARDYIKSGMRQRAQELVTLELGPQTEQEIRRKLDRQVTQGRLTDIDRSLVRSAVDNVVDMTAWPQGERQRHAHQVKLARLQVLARRGLALEVRTGLWQMAPRLEETLRQAGERGDIIKTMHRALTNHKLERGFDAYVTHGDPDQPVTGKLIGKGLAGDELQDRLHLVIDGVDGRVHYLELPEAACGDIPVGSLVSAGRSAVAPRASDRNIAELAAREGGLYEPSFHLFMIKDRIKVPGDNYEGYVEAHVRRLEALRRACIVERLSPDRWRIPDDYEAKALAHDQLNRRMALQLLSPIGLEAQVTAQAATWLDRTLLSPEQSPVSDSGFGHEVTAALAQRRQWLVQEGLAAHEDGHWTRRRNLLAVLARRELLDAGQKLARATGREFHVLASGDRVSGTYRQAVTLLSGKYALVETGPHTFTLVPWRPVIERDLGLHVSGIVRGDGISWDMGRGRGINI
jgi:type IV secretory pathway VirD2 relaxase